MIDLIGDFCDVNAVVPPPPAGMYYDHRSLLIGWLVGSFVMISRIALSPIIMKSDWDDVQHQCQMPLLTFKRPKSKFNVKIVVCAGKLQIEIACPHLKIIFTKFGNQTYTSV